MLNEFGCVARVLGHCEGFLGKDVIESICKSSNFPVVTCNIYDIKGRNLKGLEDYTIFTLGDLRILIIGVTIAYNEFYNLINLLVKDPIAEIKRVITEVNRSEYDLIFVLSHLGFNLDQELARTVDNIGVIFGGHSHTVIDNNYFENGVLICQANHHGKCIGELTVTYNLKQHKIQSFQNRLIPIGNNIPNHKIKQLILRNYNIAQKRLSRPLYLIEKLLTHSYTEESELGNLLADGLKDFLNAELGIINSGVLNHSFEQPVVTKLVLHEICPSPLNPTLVELKGVDIISTLEQSLLPEYQMKDGTGRGFRGTWLGNVQVSSNVRISYDPDEEPLSKIKKVTINDKLIDNDKWYKVATSNYLQCGTGYSALGQSRNTKYKPEMLEDILLIYLKKKKFIKLATVKRFLPQELTEFPTT
jgi:2',3'-cyclic-nucleotide 2'-phosphodiesterase (5'-nucleotidase family)